MLRFTACLSPGCLDWTISPVPALSHVTQPAARSALPSGHTLSIGPALLTSSSSHHDAVPSCQDNREDLTADIYLSWHWPVLLHKILDLLLIYSALQCMHIIHRVRVHYIILKESHIHSKTSTKFSFEGFRSICELHVQTSSIEWLRRISPSQQPDKLTTGVNNRQHEA